MGSSRGIKNSIEVGKVGGQGRGFLNLEGTRLRTSDLSGFVTPKFMSKDFEISGSRRENFSNYE